MSYGIRSKLILSFLFAILLPLGVIWAALSLSLFQASESLEPKQLLQMDQATDEVLDVILLNYPVVNNYDEFYHTLQLFLERYPLRVRILSTEGTLLFDSKDREGSKQHVKIHIPMASMNSLKMLLGGTYTSQSPLILEEKKVATVLLTFNTHAEPFSLAGKIMRSITLSLGLGFLTLILFILYISRYFAQRILRPLTELNRATENIVQGNLDIPLHYSRQDELGRFCQTFDLMRLKLKESLEKVQAEEHLRKEMIASISHDLRTPLSSIKGYVEGIQDGKTTTPETLKRYLVIIKNKTDQLNRLIDDLFHFSQLELGRLEILLTLQESQEVFESLLSPLEHEFDSHVCFIVERPIPSVPIQVDFQRLEQVIGNLIENARRYTTNHPIIRVNFEVSRTFLIIHVIDNGPGISHEDLPYLFNRFYRGEKSRSRFYGGTGLGLSICKYWVEAHGGEIGVNSLPGQGADFYFTLPIYAETLFILNNS